MTTGHDFTQPPPRPTLHSPHPNPRHPAGTVTVTSRCSRKCIINYGMRAPRDDGRDRKCQHNIHVTKPNVKMGARPTVLPPKTKTKLNTRINAPFIKDSYTFTKVLPTGEGQDSLAGWAAQEGAVLKSDGWTRQHN